MRNVAPLPSENVSPTDRSGRADEHNRVERPAVMVDKEEPERRARVRKMHARKPAGGAGVTTSALEMRAEAHGKVCDLLFAAVRFVGKLVHRHPRRAVWNPRIAREEVLMEVRDAETDHGNVHALSALGA